MLKKNKELNSDKLEPQVDKNRRRLSKLAGISPVILSLKSHSVMGATSGDWICQPSGFMSGNLSSNHDDTASCGGYSPGGWWQNATKDGNQDGSYHDWIAAGLIPFDIPAEGSIPAKNATLFEDVFKRAAPAGVVIDSTVRIKASLYEVLDFKAGSVEFHCIAGYLNAMLYVAQAGGTSPIIFYTDPARVIDMYQQYFDNGFYETTTGIKMYADDIKDFFNRSYHTYTPPAP